jgi:hypothetical protein
MTPHSPEAIAAYPMDDYERITAGECELIDAQRTAFDRGRDSRRQEVIDQVDYCIRLQRKLESLGYEAFGDFKPTALAQRTVTDREKLTEFIWANSGRLDPRRASQFVGGGFTRENVALLADRILALPSTGLVAEREAGAVRLIGTPDGQLERVWWADNWWKVAHVVLSDIAVTKHLDSGEWVELNPNDEGPRLRSGKDEA